MSPSAPFRFAGATAVLTGAASGIGEQLAHGLAARGTHLVLLDRDAAGLETVAGAIRAGHPDLPVRTVVADLAELSALPGVAERIRAEHPRIDLLVNNAGVGLGGTFEQVSAEEFDWLMDINFRAPVVLTRELLPALLAALPACSNGQRAASAPMETGPLPRTMAPRPVGSCVAGSSSRRRWRE